LAKERTMKAIAFGVARCCLSAVAIGLLLGGCDEAATPASPGAPAGDGAPAPDASGGDSGLGGIGPTLRISLDLNGPVTLHGETTSLAAFTSTGQRISSCADYAKGSTDSSGSPLIQLPSVLTTSGAPIAGHQVLFTNQLKPYHGPGSYGRDALSGQGGGATVEIDHNAFALGPSSTANTEIRPDGSGQFTFADFRGDSSGTLSGTVTWTCTG
jgi:hypothetical protein